MLIAMYMRAYKHYLTWASFWDLDGIHISFSAQIFIETAQIMRIRPHFILWILYAHEQKALYKSSKFDGISSL